MQFSPAPGDTTLAWLAASDITAFPLLMEKSQEERGPQPALPDPADRWRDAISVVIREAPSA